MWVFRALLGNLGLLESVSYTFYTANVNRGSNPCRGASSWAPRNAAFQLLLLVDGRVSCAIRLASASEYFLPTEIWSLEPRDRVSKIDHAAAGSEVENAQRPGNSEPIVTRNWRATCGHA
jgi:hypothetical protein